MYLTVAEIKKQRERQARVEALIAQADEWDTAKLLEYTQRQLRQWYSTLTDQEIVAAYNEEFTEDTED